MFKFLILQCQMRQQEENSSSSYEIANRIAAVNEKVGQICYYANHFLASKINHKATVNMKKIPISQYEANPHRNTQCATLRLSVLPGESDHTEWASELSPFLARMGK